MEAGGWALVVIATAVFIGCLLDVVLNKEEPMEPMKPFYTISVYILTDRLGEWWETLKRDGSTRLFRGANYIPDKTFKGLDDAKRYARNHLAGQRYRVILNEPPVKPAVAWSQTAVE